MHKLLIAKHIMLISMTFHGRVPMKVYALAASTALDSYSTQRWIDQGPHYYESDPLASIPCGRRGVACLDAGAISTSAFAAYELIRHPHSRIDNAAIDAMILGHAGCGIANVARQTRRKP